MLFDRICTIVLDSVGIGELPDAAQFGDQGANTLRHIASSVPELNLPHLVQLGLANIEPLHHIKGIEYPLAYYGKMAEISVGKDTMTGHWELMGLHVKSPFQVFPDGFPASLIQQFVKETGRPVIGNIAASGTAIIDQFAQEQMQTGAWIVYTSADSVFQVAAHEEVIPLTELYQACEIARRLTMKDEYAVGRVIARPYIGKPGAYQRTSNRHDYAVKPPNKTVMNGLKDADFDVIAIGKISDIFSGQGITEQIHTKSNREGIDAILQTMQKPFSGLCFCNLVDFDSLYGHRRDPVGYANALMEFDSSLSNIINCITERDLLVITADHGNDPTFKGTDHTREYVPLLVYNSLFQKPSSLGTRSTFADVAATIAENFNVQDPQIGNSFFQQLR
jgi:phosphopentomutase